MSQKFENLKISLDQDIEEKLAYLVPQFSGYRILRKSIDARRRHDIHQVFSVEVFEAGEAPRSEDYPVEPVRYRGQKPVIIGSGPAGLFAAVRLVERGIPCVLLERGSESTERLKRINRFWRYGELHTENNVCFGEGGAGLYSDGKLITRIKSPHIPYVMHRLVKFGAPPEIEYLSNPHVGSDRIRRVIPKIREFLLQNGCEIHFDTKMSRLRIEGDHVTGVECSDGRVFSSDHVVLAIGHSARDTFQTLRDQGVFMEGKSFAVGLRIEHPQSMINKIQYRQAADHPALGAANYKLTFFDSGSRIGVYSFCMCPGGYVLSAGTDPDGLVCNGMSNYNRNSPFANAAIVVSVDWDRSFAGQDIFSGFRYQQGLEESGLKRVRQAGGTRQLPVQRVEDFLEGRQGGALPSSTPSGVLATRLDQVLPQEIVARLREGILDFDSKMPGFAGPMGQLHGVETRTSCPVRITRDPDSLQSLSHSGLFPVGEGAGYAGGITSAAVDGIRAAEAIVAQISSQSQFIKSRSSQDLLSGNP